MSRTCFECQNCVWTTAEHDYSELTPGSPFDLSCAKRHWEFDPYNTTRAEFAESVKEAETCPDFVRDPALKES